MRIALGLITFHKNSEYFMAGLTTDSDLLWTVGIFIPWGWAILLSLLPRARDRYAGPLAITGTMLSVLALTGSMLSAPPSGRIEILFEFQWIAPLGLTFIIIRDGLTVMFGLLVSWISFLVTLFAWRYLPHANAHEGSDRSESAFHALIQFFTGAMFGLITAGNLLQLYFFWELTTISSYLLIAYWQHKAQARQGARLALAMTVGGSIVMLIGFFWLGTQTGIWDFAGFAAAKQHALSGPWLEACVALMLTGALAKSAQAPFSIWLPGAMHAPTPVSAFLHSSALLAAGVYLLARLYAILPPTAAWWWCLVVPGGIGAICGGLLAVRQQRLKSLLAYSTIEQFALIFMAFGLGTQEGVKAALYAFFIHAFIKSGLFLSAGAVTHITGSKKFGPIGDLVFSNPVLAVFSFLLGFSLSGVPFLGAFYYEEKFLRASAQAASWGVYGLFTVGAMFSFVYMLRFLNDIFLKREHAAHQIPPVPFSMGLAISIPAAIMVLTCIYPAWMNSHLLGPAISSTLGHSVALEVSIHFDAVFWTSIAALLGGFTIWAARQHNFTLRHFWDALPEIYSLGGAQTARTYQRLSDCLLSLHKGDLTFYLKIIFAGAGVLTVLVWGSGAWQPIHPLGPIDIPLTIMLAAMVITSAATIAVRYHFTFILVLTLSGFSMAAAFLLLGAPDVALAQVLVEILIDLSIILALKESLRVHPEKTRFTHRHDEGSKTLRWGIASAIGAISACGTVWATQGHPPSLVGQWYASNGFQATGSEDFVAMILTNFRGLDTLVEVLVFTTGMFAVLGLFWQEEIRGE